MRPLGSGAGGLRAWTCAIYARGYATHAGEIGEAVGISRMDNAYKQWATENRIRRTGMGIGTVDNEALAELESVAGDVKAAKTEASVIAAARACGLGCVEVEQ